MNSLRKKALSIYAIIEFVLFLGYLFLEMKPLKVEPYVLKISAFFISAVFVLITFCHNKVEKIFGILFGTFLAFGALFLEAFNHKIIFIHLGYSLYALAIISLYSLIVYRNHSLIILKTAIPITIFIGLFFVFNYAFKINYLIEISLIIALALSSLLFGVLSFKKSKDELKPNWFFIVAGSAFFLVYIVCYIVYPFINSNSSLKSFVQLCYFVFLIPSTIMLAVSFSKFEKMEASSIK